MKKSKLLLTLSLLSVLSLTSCGNTLKSFTKKINNSVTEVTQVVETTTITDKNVEVYKQVKTIDLSYDDKAVLGIVNIVEYNLSSNFTYVQSTSSDTFEGESKDITFSLNLTTENFITYTIEKDVLSGEVNKEQATTFFGVESIDCSSNPNVVIKLENKKIVTYDCSYLTESGKQVSINVIYSY